ncbi:upf0643 domain-containing protein [Stagonosporopsis vannaccii]|nr:upf0643 domain-containing protein [Stagonosporopsis vannaccii]
MAPLLDVSLTPHDQVSRTDTLLSKSAITTAVHEIGQPRPSILVLNPAFITQDFDALRFEAAAHNQLPSPDSNFTTPGSTASSDTDTPSPAYSTNLISSPYNTPGHYLDLSSLTTPSLLFALALTALKPARPDYATAPYPLALNFPVVLSTLRSLLSTTSFHWPSTSFYVVIFRSILHPNIDQDWLYKLDFESHREACESGGLLKYWFGKADLEGERRNLATCFWHSREDARKGGLGPWHAKARRAGRELYEQITFETVRFTVGEGAREWKVEEWEG